MYCTLNFCHTKQKGIKCNIAKEELRLLSEKNALGESLNADLDAEAEAKARLFQIEQSRDSLAKEFQAKAKGILSEEKSARASLLAEKKAEQAEQDAQDIENAKNKATKIEAVRLEAIKVADNNQRQYELENDVCLNLSKDYLC